MNVSVYTCPIFGFFQINLLLSDAFSALVFLISTHVTKKQNSQTLRHFGMITFNSSSMAYIRPFIHVVLFGVTPLESVTRCGPHPHPPRKDIGVTKEKYLLCHQLFLFAEH